MVLTPMRPFCATCMQKPSVLSAGSVHPRIIPFASPHLHLLSAALDQKRPGLRESCRNQGTFALLPRSNVRGELYAKHHALFKLYVVRVT